MVKKHNSCCFNALRGFFFKVKKVDLLYNNTIISGNPQIWGYTPKLGGDTPKFGGVTPKFGGVTPKSGGSKKTNFRNLKKNLLGKLKNIILYYFLNKYFQHLF